MPGFTDPTPTPAHTPSPPPATTGMPGTRPTARAASAVSSPTTSVEAFRTGSFSPSIPVIFTSFSDQHLAVRSMTLVPEASEYSDAMTPVRRKFTKSFAWSILRVFA